MKIAIIVAMQKELNLLLQQLETRTEQVIDDLTIYQGSLSGHDVIVAQCGIGKVNAALRTWNIIETCHPDLIINSGVAGGVDRSMAIGSILVADRVAYHDVWCGPGTIIGQADSCPLFFLPSDSVLSIMHHIADTSSLDIRFGLLCSGDSFISTPEQVVKIKSAFDDALGCDMESAAIAHACHKRGVPFMIVRVMSDMPGGEDNISQYQNFWNDAPAHTFAVVRELIDKLL